MAIAFDAVSTDQVVSAGGSTTWSHTCTGANRLLLVLVTTTNNTTITATYNGVSMTQLVTSSYTTGQRTVIFGLLAPATGTNTVAVNWSGNEYMFGGSVSYTGVLQSGLPDAFDSNGTTGATSLSKTITTIADNCWIVGDCRANVGTVNQGAGLTSRIFGNSHRLADTNGPKTPAGGFSFSCSWTGSTYATLACVSIAPNVSIDYPISIGVGSFTFTGIDELFHIALKIAMDAGSFVMTGVNTLFALGKGIATSVGSFILTGQDSLFRVVLSMALSVGSFTFTGVAATFTLVHAYMIAVSVGTFILTGMAVRFPILWKNLVKNVVSIVNIKKTNTF